jgi:hypothetical protein
MNAHRTFLRATPRDEVLAAASVITAIDRPYLRIPLDEGPAPVPVVAERLEQLAGEPAARWSDRESEVACALYALGRAYVRLEQVGISTEMDVVEGRLRELHARYVHGLAAKGDRVDASFGAPWWEIANRISRLRARVDRHYTRVLEIDGSTWHRRELLLDNRTLGEQRLPPHAAEALAALRPDLRPGDHPALDAYFRALAAAELADGADPAHLITLVMRLATEDPRHESDHATLMSPRGTNLDDPRTISRDDLLVWVVFHPDCRPAAHDGVGDEVRIRRAMHAHHAAKKQRVARRIYRDGHYRSAGLADDLGARGLFFNESAHHRGHQVAGVNAAMRSLMALHAGERVEPLRGLTDWRLTRMSAEAQDRYALDQYPSFFAYGHWVRAVLETTLQHGVVLPPTIGVR